MKRRRRVVVDDTPPTIAKRYKLPAAIVESIKEQAPHYGSQGRALQVATELLVRLARPIKSLPDVPRSKSEVIGMTYKLTPRTIELIEQLVEGYGTRGKVLQACAYILSSRLKLTVHQIET